MLAWSDPKGECFLFVWWWFQRSCKKGAFDEVNYGV